MTGLCESLPVLVVPFAACIVIASLHCYMGLHVIRRGVIFVDLALAQSAALGAAVALLVAPLIWPETLAPHSHGLTNLAAPTESQLADQLALEEEAPDAQTHAASGHTEHDAHGEGHHDEHGRFGYAMSLLFALLGAVLLSVGRFRDERVPHEAIIGIIFVVCAALSVLILSKAPHGHEKMEAMLIGSILFVNWSQVGMMGLLYLGLGVLHIAVRKRLTEITKDVAAADKAGIRIRYWDCLFYASFALMVTQSVGVAGVFVVFSFLIIPAACALLFTERFGSQLVFAWVVAVVGTVAGLLLSAVGDMPTGSSLVSCFGAMLVVCVVIRILLGKKKMGAT